MTTCSQAFVLFLCAWAWHSPAWGFAIPSLQTARLGSSATRRAMHGGDPASFYPYQDAAFRRDAHQAYKTPSRRPILAGNWKLNPATLGDATILLKLLQANFVNHRATRNSSDMPQVVVFPPTPYLEQAVHLLQGSGIQVGAQDVGLETSGAFTGEVAASMIRSVGCDFCLLGHSERRTLYEETDTDINTKVHLCLREPGLQVILCIGETLEEYGSGLLQSVVDIQIKKGLQGVAHANLHRIVIAYEPIWAIGTGKVASPEEAQQAHMAVRKSLAAVFGWDHAAQIRIQYGGSVKPDNAEEILAMPDVDGALVGGASLSADSFTRIVDGAIRSSVVTSPASLPPREFMATMCLAVKNVLGESPVWSVRDQALYWIDAPQGEVWTWNMRDPAYQKTVGTTLGCVAIQASNQKGSIVLAGESAFLSMVLSSNPSVEVLTDRPELCDVTRPNDGRVDRQGRLVFGMYNNYHRSPVGDPNVGGLYRLDQNGNSERILDESLNYRVSNCISFSPNGNTMYFCDTPTRKIYAFDYGAQLTNRRLIWTMPSNLDGGPDGAQVDADGYLWAALSGAGRVVRIDPASGTIDLVVHLPVQSPTSCTFGGPDLRDLLITTRGPDGGELYKFTLPFGMQGLPEPELRQFISQTREPELRQNLSNTREPELRQNLSENREPPRPTFPRQYPEFITRDDRSASTPSDGGYPTAEALPQRPNPPGNNSPGFSPGETFPQRPAPSVNTPPGFSPGEAFPQRTNPSVNSPLGFSPGEAFPQRTNLSVNSLPGYSSGEAFPHRFTPPAVKRYTPPRRGEPARDTSPQFSPPAVKRYTPPPRDDSTKESAPQFSPPAVKRFTPPAPTMEYVPERQNPPVVKRFTPLPDSNGDSSPEMRTPPPVKRFTPPSPQRPAPPAREVTSGYAPRPGEGATLRDDGVHPSDPKILRFTNLQSPRSGYSPREPADFDRQDLPGFNQPDFADFDGQDFRGFDQSDGMDFRESGDMDFRESGRPGFAPPDGGFFSGDPRTGRR